MMGHVAGSSRSRGVFSLVFGALAMLAVAGCNAEPGVYFETPIEGSMRPAGQPVSVRVIAPGYQTIRIGEQMVAGDGVFEATLPASDGLGFVSASAPGNELVAVRSWHQGEFVPPGSWYPDSTVIRLGPEALSGGPNTLGGLIARLLVGKELSSALVTVDIGLATIELTSAVASGMEVQLTVEGGALRMDVLATDVAIAYRTKSALFRTEGTARYSRLDIAADATLDATGIALANATVDHAPIAIKDNLLPSWALEGVVSFFDERFTAAIVEIAQQAAQSATVRVLEGIRPIPGLDLPKPIAQDSQLTTAATDGATVEIHHQMMIQAVTPIVARADQLILARPMPRGDGNERGTSLYVSRPLFNQLAYAIWDAGNFSGFEFSKERLQELGIGSLKFPYSNLQEVVIDLLVPPILEWSDDGPRFEIGGIEIDVTLDLAKDTRAWAAASVPVRLEPGPDGIRLLADPSRPVRVSEVMFERLSDLANQEQAVALIERAAPGVVSEIFGTLPTITLPTLTVAGIDGGLGATVGLHVDSIDVLPDSWRLNLAMQVQ